MKKLKQMLKAVELVVPQGVYSIGLIVNKTEKKIMWNKMPYQIKEIKVDDMKDETALLEKIKEVFESDKWLVLNLRTEMPTSLFNALKQLSVSNHCQFPLRDDVVDLKQPDTSRIMVICDYEITKRNENLYAGFKNLFGPVIVI